MKSHFLAANTPVWIEVPKGQLIDIAVSGSKTCLERERSVNTKIRFLKRGKHKKNKLQPLKRLYPWNRKQESILNCVHISPENKPPKEETLGRVILWSGISWRVISLREISTWNYEISIYYLNTREIWDRNKFVVDNIFAFNITWSNDGEFEPQIVEKCRRRNDWPMWDSNRAKLMSKIWNIWTCSPYT